jgi:signal transduction histidine kinase
MLVVGLLLLVAFISFAVGLGILLESRRTRSLEQRTFSVTTILIALWSVDTAILLLPDRYGSAANVGFFNVINLLGYAGGALLMLLIYSFGLLYPQKKPIKLFQKIVIGLGVVIAIVSTMTFVAGRFVVTSSGLQYKAAAGGAIVGVYAFIVVVGIINDNARLLRHTKNLELRRQAFTLLLGLMLTIVHAIIFIIVLPRYFNYKVSIYAIGYFAPYYYLLFTIYGLVKQRLFDLRLIIARTVGYVLVLATFTGVFLLGAIGISNYILKDPLSISQEAISLTVTVILVFAYQPLKRFFNKATNKLFYQDTYDPQTLLDQFNKVLVSTYELDSLLKQSADVLGANIKPVFSMFGLHATDTAPSRTIGSDGSPNFTHQDINMLRAATPGMDSKLIVTDLLGPEHADIRKLLTHSNIAVIARLASSNDDEGIGYLVLGSKKSGNLYNSDDLKLIEIVANELVIAIQNALHYEEIQNFNITLQQKVDDATRKLQNANKRLTALDETKDDFISMASHQLRTPLTSVKGYLSLVLEGDAGKISTLQRKMLGQAFTSSQHMVYLIADLLNVSRLKTGKFVIDPVRSNLSDVVKEEIEQLSEVLDNHSLKLVYNKPHNFPDLMLDETKTRQVIMNFVDNAIYYTPAGGVVRVELLDKPTTVELRVVDNGIGVPKSEQHHLFTKFYRAGNARKARPDGTGLGLFMAKKVVIAQGGAIIFESSEGKGSVFGFSLPKATHHLPSADATPEGSKGAAKSIPPMASGVEKVSL